MFILKKKIDSKFWKRIITFCELNELRKYKYIPNDKLSRIIYNQNLKYLNDLKNFQSKNSPVLNIDSVFKYISKLNLYYELEKNNLLDNEKRRIKKVINLLENLINQAFIGDYYIPQVTTDDTYNRLYYHPLYIFPEKIIRNLFIKFNFSNYFVYKIDVNGALIRTVFKILSMYKKDNEFYRKIFQINYDIYDSLKSSLNINITRKKFKNELITFINKGNIKLDYLPKQIVNDIKHYIHPKLNVVRKYMTLFSNEKLQLIQSKFFIDSCFLYVNLDGGVLLSKEKIKFNKNQLYNNVKIENWV